MHPLKRFKLSRRSVLRGLGGGAAVSLALPPLEAMLNANGTALANGEEFPCRFITWMYGNGVDLEAFEPTQTGPNWTLPTMLEEFAPVKDYVTVLTGLDNHSADFITHHEGMIAFSGYNYIRRDDLPNFASDWGGPTIDQVIAGVIADQVTLPVRSLQVGVSRHLSEVDNGTTAEALSCRGTPGNLVPLPPDFQPISVWETLFGEFIPKPDDRALRGSALDMVRADADRLRSKLGVVDNQRLDAHFDGLRELENKITALPPTCELPGSPTLVNDFGIGAEPLTQLNQVMSDLIAMAFRCDVTRVASLQFIHIAAEVPLPDAGQVETHHNLSHINNDSYRDGCRYVFGRMSDLMQTLLATEDIDGMPLLDSTMILAASDLAVGFTHQYNRQPLVIGGHGRGHLQHPGIHYQAVAAASPNRIDAPAAGNVTDVLLTCLQAFDPSATEVGADEPYSNTPLTAIMA